MNYINNQCYDTSCDDVTIKKHNIFVAMALIEIEISCYKYEMEK